MKKSAKISDKELKALLASLKEEVAAPLDFRARVLKRLAPDMVQEPSLLERLSRYFSRPAWTIAGATALLLGFVLWFAVKPQPGKAPQAMDAVAPAAQVLASAPKAALPHPQAELALAPARPKPELAVVETASSSKSAASGAAVAGAGSRESLSLGGGAPGTSQIPQFSSSGGGAKPDVIVVEPSPTPDVNPLAGNSQVRRNKFRASVHEYAAILYQLKGQEKVRIEIYDRLGHLVALLLDSSQAAGVHEIHWFGHDDHNDLLPSGIYLVRIKTDHYDERHKVVFIR